MGGPFFLTKERRRFFLRRIFLPILIVHFGLCVAATANNALRKKDIYAAILISDYAVTKYDYWASPLAFAGAYPYWTYYFNNRGMKVKWFLRAKSTDLAKVIRDEKFQSIVLVGHGSFNSWQAVDMLVTNAEVVKMMEGVKKKRGEWIQLTCAVEVQWPIRIGELVMEPRNVYAYDDRANTFYFVMDAILGFKLIKSKLIHSNA